MPVVVTLAYHAAKSSPQSAATSGSVAPWYIDLQMLVAIVVVGATAGRLVRMPGSGLLGPMAITIMLELTGLSFGLSVPALLVQPAPASRSSLPHR